MDNFYNTESVLKDDILSLYNQVQPRDLRKVANAFDVKVLMDAVSARVDVLAKNLEERLPVAPNQAGRYYLVANVRNNMKGETTATYTWDGVGGLPNVHVPTDTNDILGPSDYDADGNLFVPYGSPEYAEYALKMRVVKTTNDVGETIYAPRVMWVRMDKASSDYSDTWLALRNHPAVIKAVSEGRDETEVIREFMSKIDSNASTAVEYITYDITGTQGFELLSSCYKSSNTAKVGATVADVVDFSLYNVKVLLDDRDPTVYNAQFAEKVDGRQTIDDLSGNSHFVEISSKEDASKVLLGDDAAICLIRKTAAHIGD